MAFFEPDRPQTGFDRTTLGKILHVLGTGERLGTRYLLSPLAKGLSPEARARLDALEGRDLYASDVYQALRPEAGTVERTVAGIGLGAAVDPLTYIGGGLTKAGKLARIADRGTKAAKTALALSKAGKAAIRADDVVDVEEGAKQALKLAPSLTSQAKAGQWSFLQARIPGKEIEGTIPLLPTSANAFIARRLELIQKGKLFQQIMPTHVGKAIDAATVGLLQKFNVPVGMDRWFWSKWKQFLSSALGRTSRFARVYGEQFEDSLDILAEQLARTHDIPLPEARSRLNNVIVNMEATPEVGIIRDASNLITFGKKSFRNPVGDKDLDAIWEGLRKQYPKETYAGMRHIENTLRDVFEDNFPLPPAMGGPASPFESREFRALREIVLDYKGKNDEILQLEMNKLGRNVKLWSHHDQLYWLHQLTDDTRRILFQKAEEVFTGKGIKGMRPSVKHASQIVRSLRMIDPDALEQLRPVLSSVPVPRGGNMDLYSALKDRAMQGVIPGHKLQELFYKTFERNNRQFKDLVRKNLREMSKDPWFADVEKPLRVGFARDRALREMPVGDADWPWRKALPTMSVDQANQYVAERGLRLRGGVTIAPGEITQFFDNNPTQLLSSRRARAEHSILVQELFDEVRMRGDGAKEALLADPSWDGHIAAIPMDLARGNPRFAGWAESVVPELKGYAFEPETARWFNRMAKAERQFPKELTGFASLYQKVTQLWKSYTLSLFPVYHVRNFVGNMWNYWLAADNPVQAAENVTHATKAINAIRAGKGSRYYIKDAVNGVTYTADQIWDEVAKRGGWGIGFLNPDDPASVAAEIGKRKKLRHAENIPLVGKFLKPEDPLELAARELGRSQMLKRTGSIHPPSAFSVTNAAKGIFDPENAVLQTGFRIGNVIENNARLAHVIQKLRTGFDFDEAVKSMKGVLFDYHDLSPLERNSVRNWFPFYAWSRKNIPFQLEMLITKPEKIARFNGALRGVSGWEQPEEEKWVNNYLRENFPLRIRRNPKTGQQEYFVFRNWLPLADIHDLTDPLGWLMQSLHPVPKGFLEQAVNLNFFTRRKVDHMQKYLAGPAEIARGFAGKGERQKYFLAKLAGKETLPNRMAHVLNSFRPINTIHQWIDNPQEQEFSSHLLRLLAGRTYALDTNRAMREFQSEMDEVRKDTRKALLSSAYRRMSPDDLLRLELEGRKRQERLAKDWGQL